MQIYEITATITGYIDGKIMAESEEEAAHFAKRAFEDFCKELSKQRIDKGSWLELRTDDITVHRSWVGYKQIKDILEEEVDNPAQETEEAE